MRFHIILAVGILAASPALANDLFVRDGDSFSIGGQEVRLWGIDAPEYHQNCFTLRVIEAFLAANILVKGLKI